LKNSVCFITCVNNENLYLKCLEHINNLIMPEGFVSETIAIRNAKSMTNAYNEAMSKSNAKYKVYLHQDTFIINRNFIQDFVDIFSSSSEIGLLGMVGTDSFPVCCNWGKSHIKYGNLIQGMEDGSRRKRNFINKELKPVICVDGLILITQYDVPWREDIFDGWHFYDISQCMEFHRNKYQVCVPYQQSPWCIHDCGKINFHKYNKYKHIFLKEYFHELFPCNYWYTILINRIYDFRDLIRPLIKTIETKLKKCSEYPNKIT
jgi:hypothetical protein